MDRKISKAMVVEVKMRMLADSRRVKVCGMMKKKTTYEKIRKNKIPTAKMQVMTKQTTVTVIKKVKKMKKMTKQRRIWTKSTLW